MTVADQANISGLSSVLMLENVFAPGSSDVNYTLLCSRVSLAT